MDGSSRKTGLRDSEILYLFSLIYGGNLFFLLRTILPVSYTHYPHKTPLLP